MLKVKDLTIAIDTPKGRFVAVENVGFTVSAGRTFALVGESGCGKSLTALSLMRLLPHAARIVRGIVELEGVDLLGLTQEEMCGVRGSRIAMIFQEPATALNPVVPVVDQVAEAVLLHSKTSKAEARQVARRWLSKVGLDAAKADSFAHELSGGQKQRVMIAMALVNEPKVVIADEPTTALDVTLQAQILDLLKEMQREMGLALVLITHDLAVVRKYCDEVALMYAGQIVERAPVAEFFANPSHPYARALLEANPDSGRRGYRIPAIAGNVPPIFEFGEGCRFMPRCSAACAKCPKSGAVPMVTVSEGHVCACPNFAAERKESGLEKFDSNPAGDELLRIRNLCVSYEKGGSVFWRRKVFEAVKNADLVLRRGETLALVGESGSGKTTLGKAALGILEGARITGSVDICGIESVGASSKDRRKLRRMAQIVFQDPFASLDPRMTIGESIAEGMVSLGVVQSEKEAAEQVAALLESVGLSRESAGRLPHEFSGGQRQRVAIARALAVKPEIIVCDEPTSALDVSVQAQIINLIRDLQKSTGVALLFITHNFAVVKYLADTVAVMRNGVIVEQGTAQDVLENPQNEYTRKLLAAVPEL